MTKNKRILLSLCISLLLFIIFNVIYLKLKNEEEIDVFVVTKSISTGESITLENTQKIRIKADEIAGNFVSDLTGNSYSNCALKIGQILTQDLLESSENLNNDEYENITLPVTSADDAAAYKLKKGSKVNIYYTAKYSDVTEAVAGAENLQYSSNSQDNIITLKLYEDMEVVDLTDSVGQTSGMYTEIQIRVKKQDVTRLVCLKQLGTFTLTISR